MKNFILLLFLIGCISSPNNIDCWMDGEETYCNLSNINFDRFYEKMNIAIRDLDQEKMAKLIQYPLEIEVYGNTFTIENESDFVAYSDYIMSDFVKFNFITQNYSEILCDDKCCHIGNGAIKITPTHISEIKIIDISTSLYSEKKASKIAKNKISLTREDSEK